jgi:AraC-like DNA-binding protein
MGSSLNSAEIKAEPTVSNRVLRALTEAVLQAGLPRLELLRSAGLREEQLDDQNARVSYSEFARICEAAMDLTQDPALGLHWGEAHASHSFPVFHLVAHAPNLREGLASLARFERLLTDEPNFCLVEHGSQVALRCTPGLSHASSSMRRFAADMMIVGFLRFVRSFSPAARPARIAIQHEAPPYQTEYARILGQQVHFAQPHTELVFERALLDTLSPFRDEGVHEVLRPLGEDRVARLTQDPSYALRVRDYLVKHGRRERVNMEGVARALGLSLRSLRRRLDAEGKTFVEIENDALATAAKHLLRDKQLTIQEAAYEMGFSSTTTFHHAFKRWTGSTPGTYSSKRPGPGLKKPGGALK